MSTAKRERQKAARAARLEAERRAANRRKTIRRTVTGALAIALVIGIIAFANSGSKKAATTTTTTAPYSGGSGNTSPSAITTSAHCPASLTATLNKPKYPNGPTGTLDPNKTYTADVKTDVGSFTIALDAKNAPNTVRSFVFLAQHHFFDCIVFHRVITGFMDQVGDPTGTGSGGPGYKFNNENLPKSYATGEVAMANSGANTNGSQFFIIVPGGASQLQPLYNLFGTVTSGMSVVEQINKDAVSPPSAPKHRIISVTINES